ncbi:MAG: hypothetical protein NVSMB23_17810 [Myxococcales bacterium]
MDAVSSNQSETAYVIEKLGHTRFNARQKVCISFEGSRQSFAGCVVGDKLHDVDAFRYAYYTAQDHFGWLLACHAKRAGPDFRVAGQFPNRRKRKGVFRRRGDD